MCEKLVLSLHFTVPKQVCVWKTLQWCYIALLGQKENLFRSNILYVEEESTKGKTFSCTMLLFAEGGRVQPCPFLIPHLSCWWIIWGEEEIKNKGKTWEDPVELSSWKWFCISQWWRNCLSTLNLQQLSLAWVQTWKWFSLFRPEACSCFATYRPINYFFKKFLFW